MARKRVLSSSLENSAHSNVSKIPKLKIILGPGTSTSDIRKDIILREHDYARNAISKPLVPALDIHGNSWSTLLPTDFLKKYITHSIVGKNKNRKSGNSDSKILALATKKMMDFWHLFPKSYDAVLYAPKDSEGTEAGNEGTSKDITIDKEEKCSITMTEQILMFEKSKNLPKKGSRRRWMNAMQKIRNEQLREPIVMPEDMTRNDCIIHLAQFFIFQAIGVTKNSKDGKEFLTISSDEKKSEESLSILYYSFRRVLRAVTGTKLTKRKTKKAFNRIMFKWLQNFGTEAYELASQQLMGMRAYATVVRVKLPESLEHLPREVERCPLTSIIYFTMLQLTDSSKSYQVDYDFVITTELMFSTYTFFMFEMLVKKPARCKDFGPLPQHIQIREVWNSWYRKMGEEARDYAHTLFMKIYFP